jgi:hypothetical protein
MISINLRITNNSSTELPISILGNTRNTNNIQGYKTSYDFDMTGEVLLANFDFKYSDKLNPLVDIIHNFIGVSPTLFGYVEALNTLNVGLFTFSGNIIYMFSNNYIGKEIKV